MHAPGKRVAIVQSNYVPWKGYFDLIGSVDEFVLYDDVQYTRRDWRNRNLIKTATGLQWLTIPVEVKGKYHQRIRDVAVSDADWARTHWKTLGHHYARAQCFRDMKTLIEGWYDRASGLRMLSDINEHFLRAVCDVLNIATAIKRSSDYELVDGRSERLLELCRQAGATTYLSGPSARGYLDEAMFAAAGVRVEWMDYGGYREYPQLHPPFEHGVSVLDLLFNTGHAARGYLKGATPPETHARA